MSVRLPGMTGDGAASAETQGDALGPMSGGMAGGDEQVDVLGEAAPSAGLIGELTSGPGGMKAPGRAASIRSTGILIAVAICAGGVLVAMRHVGMNGSLAFAQKPIAIDYKERDQATLLDHQRLMGDLRASSAFDQIALRDIHMNPFIWKPDLKPVPEEPSDDRVAMPQEDPWERELKERRERISTALDGLRLSSVIGGSALMSGRSYSVGDTIADGLFTVVAINGAGSSRGPSVTLEVPESARAEHRFYIIAID